MMDFALKVERKDIAVAKIIAHTKRLHRFRHGHVSVEAVCDNERRVGWVKETPPRVCMHREDVEVVGPCLVQDSKRFP